MTTRHYSPLDALLVAANDALQTVFGSAPVSARTNPAAAHAPNETLTDTEKRHAASLMRINHAGEIAAQALYQGQALTARESQVQEKMAHAAQEENDHLAWCQERLTELNSRKSLLTPAWYAGSFAIGALAGAAGDKWSLGFVVETERQVIRHLDEHLQKLPTQDARSQAILRQMRDDEAKHATMALAAGAAELPYPVKKLMTAVSKVMTTTAYWI